MASSCCDLPSLSPLRSRTRRGGIIDDAAAASDVKPQQPVEEAAAGCIQQGMQQGNVVAMKTLQAEDRSPFEFIALEVRHAAVPRAC